jgi:hypothetical protein
VCRLARHFLAKSCGAAGKSGTPHPDPSRIFVASPVRNAFESRGSPHDLCCVADASSFATKMPLQNCADPACSCMHTRTVTVYDRRPESRFQQAFHEIDMDERHVESVDFAHLVLVVWNMLLKHIVRGACGGPAT